MRATKPGPGGDAAVPLAELVTAMSAAGAELLSPTGGHTRGLLEQVFTRPRRPGLPAELRAALRRVDPGLDRVVENAKLLELVSRREMPPALAARYFGLYGLPYRPLDPLHSAPVFTYFLPAQAAHVIRTSLRPPGDAAEAPVGSPTTLQAPPG